MKKLMFERLAIETDNYKIDLEMLTVEVGCLFGGVLLGSIFL